MARIKAILFDIDGTLLDSNHAHAQAWVDALRGHGKEVAFELVRSKIGKGGDRLLMEVVGIESDSREGEMLNAKRSAILKELYLPDLAPTDGARELVAKLQSLGLRCLSVTSSTKDDLAHLLRKALVADLLTEAVTSDDADQTKPSPDSVQAALDKIHVTANEAIMIGDTPYDIAAASRAGVKSIAFRSGGWSDEELKGAAAIYDHPRDLLAHFDDSPLAA